MSSISASEMARILAEGFPGSIFHRNGTTAAASDCVLLNADVLPGNFLDRNDTSAQAMTSKGSFIEAYLRCPDPERPLLPAILFVRCFAADFHTHPPRVVRAVEDLILFRIVIGPAPQHISPADYDYFVYQAPITWGVPDLRLLPRLPPSFHDNDVGLLRRGDRDFSIAALIATDSPDVYDLHRFDSATCTWLHFEVKLVAPQAPFPCKIPWNSARMLYHHTSTVVTIGGEGGTMGWVDLWHGILLCDVLDPEPTLRGVPLPLPLELLAHNNGQGAELGCPKSLRGIAFVQSDGGHAGCLRFVHLEAKADKVPRPTCAGSDGEEIYEPDCDWAMRDWAITTWSNHKMTTSWDDWTMDYRKAKASFTNINSELRSKMLHHGLLSACGSDAGPERAFQNLLVSDPAPGMDEGVVYLQARVKFEDSKVFALDAKNNQLLAAAEFTSEIRSGAGIQYFPSIICRYINPHDRVLPNPPGDGFGCWGDESSREPEVPPDFAGILLGLFTKGRPPSFEEGSQKID